MADQAVVSSSTPPWYRDVRVLRIVAQVVFGIGVAITLWVLWTNLTVNMANANLPTGFDYLRQPGGIQVAGAPVTSSTPIWRLVLVGAKNTAIVSAVGIVAATILGVVVGVARLSSNWLVRKAAALYVEAIRNIPVLVVITFFAAALILQLPQIQADPITLGGYVVISNREMALTSVTLPEGRAFGWIVVAAIFVALAVAWWRTRRSDRTGEPHHRVLWGLGTWLAITLVAFVVMDSPVVLSHPSVEGLRVEGGFGVAGPVAGLIAGLTVYTASHIAEIVRGSILAVPHGQWEAGDALALSGFQRLRFVVLPQALRIMVPPMANQYLNLMKNSSLGIAIGAAELTAITQTIIANGRPAPQNLGILMLIYLSYSLLISVAANAFNRRIQYVTN